MSQSCARVLRPRRGAALERLPQPRKAAQITIRAKTNRPTNIPCTRLDFHHGGGGGGGAGRGGSVGRTGKGASAPGNISDRLTSWTTHAGSTRRGAGRFGCGAEGGGTSVFGPF